MNPKKNILIVIWHRRARASLTQNCVARLQGKSHQEHHHHLAATGEYLHLQITIIMMILIVVIIIIVRSHLGSSVRVACEGRLLTNDVRGFTNRDVD